MIAISVNSEKYADAGVSRDTGDALVSVIQRLTKAYPVKNRKVSKAVGGYAALYKWSSNEFLAATTDGVGTKLKLAMDLNNHTTIGQDLVAMSVNDLICVGAEPLFFLDYFATSKLSLEQGEAILSGVVKACQMAGCALVGGETAEMPGFYQPGEYDLAGFAVGRVKAKDVLPKATVRRGDVLIGVGSSGFHSNGFSLIRKWIERDPNPTERAIQCLEPTRIYVQSVLPLIRKHWVKGLAHITGSGMLNIPRISEKVGYRLTLPPESELPEVFSWARSQPIEFSELVQTFNMGLGLVAVVAAKDTSKVLKHFRSLKIPAWEVGEVVKGKGEVEVSDARGSTARLH